MEISSTVYYFLFGSCIFWSSFIFCNVTLKKNTSALSCISTIVLFYIAITALYFYTPLQTISFIDYIIGFLPFALIPILYKTEMSKIIFVYFSNMLFVLILHISTNIFINSYYPSLRFIQFLYELSPVQMFRIFSLLFQIVYITCIYLLLKGWFIKMLKTNANIIQWICLYPLFAFFLLLINYILLADDLTKLNNNVITLFSLMLVVSIGYILLFVTLPKTNIIKKEPKKQNKQTAPLKQESNLLKASANHYYETLIRNFINADVKTQNVIQHLDTLRTLIYNQNLHGAMSHLDFVQHDLQNYQFHSYTPNQNLNLLLTYYEHICAQEQILLRLQLNIMEAFAISDLDVCILFGNCIENAIEACRYIQIPSQRFIQVEANLSNHYLKITIKNSFDGYINKVNNQLKSRKKVGGAGLLTIQEIVKEYKGSIQMQHSQDMFTIQITMSTNKKLAIPMIRSIK